MTDVPELYLRKTLAILLDEWDLAIYNPVGALPERGVKVEGDFPTSLNEFTFLTSPPTTRDGGRADRLLRVQFLTRRTGSQSVVEEWAYDLSTHLDHAEYLPNVLGISFSQELSRMYFDKDTQGRSDVAATYVFRGRF